MLALFLTLTIATTFCVNSETRFVLDPEKRSWVKKPIELVIPAEPGVVQRRLKTIDVEKHTLGCDLDASVLDASDVGSSLMSHFTSVVKTEKKFELQKGTYRINLPVMHEVCGSWWHFAFNVSLSAQEPFLVKACTERYFVRVFPETDIEAREFKAKFEECGGVSLTFTFSTPQTLTLILS